MLVIVDLQEQYLRQFLKREPEWEKFLVKLDKRVFKAKDSMEVIINLTCQIDGMTIPAVLEMINDYPLKYGIDKADFDGSEEIIRFIDRKKMPFKSIELCGAFKDICVLDTWKGLKLKGYSVLPVQEDLVIETLSNWREIHAYPEGYIRPGLAREPRESL